MSGGSEEDRCTGDGALRFECVDSLLREIEEFEKRALPNDVGGLRVFLG